MKPSPFISLHRGHSGEFCSHARDRLEEIIHAYIKKGFKVVGITEHMPPVSDLFLYPDEIEQGLTAQAIQILETLGFDTHWPDPEDIPLN